MRRVIFFTAIILINAGVSYGQEMAYGYYNYILNPYNLNSAYVENDESITAILNTKTYMAGFGNAPRNTMFGIAAPVSNEQVIGARIISDRRGAYELSKYDLTYSYQLKIDEMSNLRFGVSAGAVRRMLNPNSIDNVEHLNQADPTIASGYYDEVKFIAGIGMIYQFKKLKVGFSAPHLVLGNEEMSEFIVGSVDYEFHIGETDFSLEPRLIYQNLPVLDNTLDILLRTNYREKVWVQLGYQTTENLNFALGFDFGAFGLGYSYGMNNRELSDIASNSNEIMIQFSFLSPKNKKSDD